MSAPNLERDILSSDWFVKKVHTSNSYAQNLYAALCNTQWQKLGVIPILKEERWSCSWRYAGGLVADVLNQGDYLDWYCSGIYNTNFEEEFQKKPDDRYFVAEGTITEEIRKDLHKLGWVAVSKNGDST